VAADGRMKLAKAEEYLMKNLQSLRFYQEGDKCYFEGYVAEVPEGFENRLAIAIVFKQGSGLPVANYNTIPYLAVIDLPKMGPFKEEISGISNPDKIDYIHVTMAIEALKHTNTNKGGESYEVYWTIYSSNDNRIACVDCITREKQTNKFYDLSKLFTW
jgi:hypothetical protein